jgi:hypothetical protein
MAGSGPASRDADITVTFSYEEADVRAVEAAYRRRYKPQPRWLLGGAVAMVTWIVGTVGMVLTATPGYVIATALGLVLLVAWVRPALRRQSRARIGDTRVGPPVSITIGEYLTYTCPGERLTFDWGVLTIERAANLMLLQGPHGHVVFIPDRVAGSPAEFEAIVAQVAMRIHQAHEATTPAADG